MPINDSKKWVVGVVCLVAVALSVWSVMRQMPKQYQGGYRAGGYPSGPGSGPQLPGTRGKIVTVSAGAITIQPRNGSPKTFALTSATKISVDQALVAAADLKAGQRARVVSADDKTATEIHVRTRPFGGAPGGPPGGPGGSPAPAPRGG